MPGSNARYKHLRAAAALVLATVMSQIAAQTRADLSVPARTEPHQAVRTVQLHNSQIADQVMIGIWENSETRKVLHLSGTMAYRERISGAVRPVSSQEYSDLQSNARSNAVSYLRPFRVAERADQCATSQLTPAGDVVWKSHVPARNSESYWCESLAVGLHAEWILAGNLIHRIDPDGKILHSFPDINGVWPRNLSVNIDSATGDLLLVRDQKDPSGQLTRVRLSTNGQITRQELGLFFPEYPELVATDEGRWRLLVRGDTSGSLAVVEWSADFDSHESLALDRSIGSSELFPTIYDVRWLDSDNALMLIQYRNLSGIPTGFRVTHFLMNGKMHDVIKDTAGHSLGRLYPVPDDEGIKRHVVVSVAEDGMVLSMRLLRGAEWTPPKDAVAARHYRNVSPAHRIWPIGDSGEFVLAERMTDRMKVSLLSAEGRLLEQHEVILVTEEPSNEVHGLKTLEVGSASK